MMTYHHEWYGAVTVLVPISHIADLQDLVERAGYLRPAYPSAFVPSDSAGLPRTARAERTSPAGRCPT